MFKSQSFNEPMLLDCEFHKYFCFFPPLLGEIGWLMWAGVVYFPSRGSVRH